MSTESDRKILAKYGPTPVEYTMLKTDFRSYRSPKDKIDALVNAGLLIRLKKGLYVVSKTVSGQAYQNEVIANNLYGPSYVSLETALSHYGIIPEAVHTTRSVTIKKARTFLNDVGRFEYFKAFEDYYSIGIAIATTQQGQSFLIASPEKAVCDTVYFTRGLRLQSKKAMREFLFEDMRMDFDSVKPLDLGIIRDVIGVGRKRKVYELLLEVLEDE